MFFAQAQAASVEDIKASIVKHAVEMGVDPAIALSIAKTESGYKHETRSPRGAVGVFQLMPSTARRMGLNPYSLDDNIKGGIMYYKSMYQMFGTMQLAIAAYNAGPGTVKRFRSIPPYRETKRYVAKIMEDYHYLKAHTDPAVVAYNKKKDAVAKQTKKQAKQEIISTEKEGTASVIASTTEVKPEKIQTPKVMANMPANTAPLPTSEIEKARKYNVETIKGLPTEVNIKTQSIEI
jgi:membrane-bound lytic murein transglycosylase MltF